MLLGGTVSIEDLREHDTHLRELYDWYRNHAPRLGIETVTYFESRGIKGCLPIVNPTSAHPGVGANPVPLDEDHISISKPRDRHAQVCGAVRDILTNQVFANLPNFPSDATDIQVPIHFEETGKLIDVVQRQANMIEQLLMPPGRVLFSTPMEQDAETGYVTLESQIRGDKFQVTSIPRQEADEFSGEAFVKARQRATVTDITELIEKLGTVDEIASEIKSQISVWNYDAALVLSVRLEEHLMGIEASTCPKLIQYLFLIAKVNVISAEKKDINSSIYIEKANSILDKIDAQLAISPRHELAEDVIALKGSIESIQNGLDAALQLLVDRNDPYAIRIRIALYMKKHDSNSAIELIEGKTPHQKWCDYAIKAYFLADRIDDAREIVNWASKQDDLSMYLQCVVHFADASLVRALADHCPGKNILLQDLCEAELIAVQQVLKDLDPVLSPIITNGSVDSELAIAAVKIAWQAHHLLGHHDEVATLARLMSTHTPVPIDVARSVMSGYMIPPPDLPKRLREDHPGDLSANILAALVELHTGDQIKAFEEAKKLTPLATTNDDKGELFRLFQQMWHELDGDAVTECESIASSLIVHDTQLQMMFDAARALRAGNGALALDILDKEKAENDVYWLQLKSSALMQLGNLSEAVEALQLAARQTGAPILLHQTADLAFKAKMASVAVECYEELIATQPNNLIARSNLVSLYTFHLHDIEKAATHCRALHEAEPLNQIHTVNLAVLLSRLYRPEESLPLYNNACKTDHPDLRAVLGRAELYLGIGDPDAACASLGLFRNTFWESPDFLLACMNTAYAAGNDEFAHDALIKLNELRSTGLIDESAFRLVHNDELVEFFKESLKASEDRNTRIHVKMLKGQMPWIWIAQLSTDATYWAWRLRTQDLDWIGDDPVYRAGHTIYSTNGFHAREMKDGRRTLLPLECPPPGTPVVADLSALITLHRLDLLDKAADYFGEVQIPQAYLEIVLQDGKKLVFHQRSRHRTAEEITFHVSTKTITVLKQEDDGESLFPVVDEYNDDDIHRYHLIDVIKPVYEDGLIDDAAFERIRKICQKPSSVDDVHQPLARLQDVHIELSTLETLALFGHLATIVRFYRVHIADEAKAELQQRLNSLRFQQEIRGWHFDLWNYIRSDNRFRFVRSVVPQEMGDKSLDDKVPLAFSAYFIAQDKRIPLLVDDRTCQAMMLNMCQDRPHAAFGTDAVVLALSESSDLLSELGAAEAILTLMRWRYRFLLPSVSILKTYAAQYRGNPPGLPLRNVAEYVHDCMRDSGLFDGPENTELNESMAIRLYLSWLKILAEWLVDLWGDRDFTNDTASQLTDWCIQECLPSLPRVMHPSAKARIGSLTSKIFISHILFNLIYITDKDRACECMKSIQNSLKLSNEKYLKIVTEILNDARRS